VPRNLVNTRDFAGVMEMGFHNAKTLYVGIALALLLSGCSSGNIYKLELMPAPEIFAEPDLIPLFDNSPENSSAAGSIFYATDRMPAKKSDEEKYYRNKRGHILRLGIGNVQLEESRLGREETEKISLLKNREKVYELNVADIKELGVLSTSRSEIFDSQELKMLKSADSRFAAEVNKKLGASKTSDIYIYVHGYRIVFTNPLLVATELWHYLGYDGVFIAYSWPATPNRLAYARDVETAAYSSRKLRLLIEYLSQNTNARHIHIIAHSAGTRVAIDALGQLALLTQGKEKSRKYRIGNVLLIGSDFDRDIFSGNLEDGMLEIPTTLTLYMSSTDKALRLSRFLFTRKRLGQTLLISELTKEAKVFLQRTPKLTIVDVTNAKKADAERGHDYFRRSPWVSSDILMLLKFNLTPKDRGLVRGMLSRSGLFRLTMLIGCVKA